MIELEARDEPGGVVVLRCRGRLDMSAAPALRAAVWAAARDGATVLVVDLAETSFLDSSGLGALIAGLKTMQQAGGDLRLAGPGAQVRMVLELTQLDAVLPPHPDVRAALRDG